MTMKKYSGNYGGNNNCNANMNNSCNTGCNTNVTTNCNTGCNTNVTNSCNTGCNAAKTVSYTATTTNCAPSCNTGCNTACNTGYNNQSKQQLLQQINQLSFCLVDLNQYLDMHPDNQEAITQFNCFFQQYWDVKTAYTLQYGPLNNFGFCPASYPWSWTNDPWPWDRGGCN